MTIANMVLAYHLIFTLYGWWLPNDPRGSSSHTIRCDVIADLGQLHHGRKQIQPASNDIREFYKRARAVNETFQGRVYIIGSSIVISLTIVAVSWRV